MHNPLKRPILEILKNTDGVLKEYELHTILGGDAFSQFLNGCSSELSLFRKHFLVMNALYELHDELLPQGLYLHISALAIQLKEVSHSDSDQRVLSTDAAFEKLSRYYRDWQHFIKTDDSEVAALLQQFWNKFLALEEKTESLSCLELDATADWPDIQQQYRRLCQQYHPDKGGDVLYFMQIRQAYDNLKCLYERHTIN